MIFEIFRLNSSSFSLSSLRVVARDSFSSSFVPTKIRDGQENFTAQERENNDQRRGDDPRPRDGLRFIESEGPIPRIRESDSPKPRG